jgi:2',3'-cyclic-nucleotide 2'-phosphodiesterase / 3'-nucleotidase
METKKIRIIYTSDVHGQLSATNYAFNRKNLCGLTRISTYLNQLPDETILLDNGDILQGNPMLDYSRLFLPISNHPLPLIMNHLQYRYLVIGNHDFNYGQPHLHQMLDQIHATPLCANIVNKDHKCLFTPYAIHHTLDGLRIGIIGVVTQYIPHWEQKEYIQDLTFLDAYETVKSLLPEVKEKSDIIVVLYHGGYERDMITGLPHGRLTDENQGYKLSTLKDINILLTGHQHVPQVHSLPQGVTLQTGMNAYDFGEIIIEYEKIDHINHISAIRGRIIPNSLPENPDVVQLLSPYEELVNTWLDQHIGTTPMDFSIYDPLFLRVKKHPLFQLINHVQISLSGAQISCASLPNNPPGFSNHITRREIMANFIYPNTLVKLQINGKILRLALERNAEYFIISNRQLSINSAYISPKLEHYNYDVYDGIEYVIDVKKPFGTRITQLTRNGIFIQDTDQFELVLNNYRAAGGGDFDMFADAVILEEYDVSLSTLMSDYIEKEKELQFELVDNFLVVY